MCIEDKLHDLDEAVRELTKAVLTLAAAGYRTAVASETQQSDAPEAKKRGRPAKAAAAAPEEFKDITPQPADAVAEEKAGIPPAPAVEGSVLDKKAVQDVLIGLVKKHGRDACGALCRRHGGPNLTALDPAVWPALHAEALKLTSLATLPQ